MSRTTECMEKDLILEAVRVEVVYEQNDARCNRASVACVPKAIRRSIDEASAWSAF